MKNDFVVAVAASDFHFHKFQNFNVENSRLKNIGKAVLDIAKVARDLKVPLLFCGDLLHNPKEVDNDVLNYVFEIFDIIAQYKVPFIAIPGNHDMNSKNTLEHKSNNWLIPLFRAYGNIRLEQFMNAHIYVKGIEYYTHNEHLVKVIKKERKTKYADNQGRLKILLLHSDAPGAVTPEGFELEEAKAFPTNLDEFFKDWDLVLFGHIHKPQKLSEKCYMLGSHIHQTAGDCKTKMGYWLVYKSGKMEFVELKGYPKFIKLKKGEKPKDDGNYYIPFDEVISEEAEIDNKDFNINKSRKNLAKNYLKHQGIKSASKRKALIKALTSVE